MSKKEVKKAVVKKEVVTAPKKEVKVTGLKKIKSSVEFVSFSVKATIPVMVFGNIQPEIVVKAKTIEEAMNYTLPIIEGLFNSYVEAPRDGSPKPSFSKANVTVTEKQVARVPVTPPNPSVPTLSNPLEPKISSTTDEKFDKEIEETLDQAPGYVKSPMYEKAEKAIGSAMSNAALDLIEQRIKESDKITQEEKPMLFTVLLKRRKEVE